MKMASKLAYLKRKPACMKPPSDKDEFATDVDTNIVGIGFDILKDSKNKIH
jgi:hypothetical protein